MSRISIFITILFLISGASSNAQEKPVYSWSFDQVEGSKLIRDAGSEAGIEFDSISGNFSLVEGVDGAKALRLDGFTTQVHVNPTQQINGSFTIEAWLSQSAYAWNWAPIITHKAQGRQQKLGTTGFYFGVGPKGEMGLEIWIEGELYRCISQEFTLELFKWYHVGAVVKEGEGIYLYCNGMQVGFTAVDASFSGPQGGEMLIGMNEEAVKPSHIHRQHGTLPYFYSIDGALDNLKIYNKAMDSDQLAWSPGLNIPEDGSLQRRKMPEVPDRDKFGAYYTKLEYYKEWDQLWPVGEHTDVVVTFENLPMRLVFWRGSRYSAAWVSDDDFWMGDQSVEAWENGHEDAEGCFEHMQDRHCRYSHVRILESTPARVLVHWRYAPVSAHNSLWRPDPKTGWACWVDEYYYVYPDGTAIRHVQWKKGSLGYPRQFQESLGFSGPGQTRGDILEMEWLTVTNHKGEERDFRFTENPDFSKEIWTPESYNIQKHHFKSEYDPFIVFEEENTMFGLRDKDIRDYTSPGKYNHWPVGQAYCDGRSCVATDRPAHFITFPVSTPVLHENETREWWHGLYGMTNRSVPELITLSKSWNNAPAVRRSDNSALTYDKAQRAYIEESFTGGKLVYKVEATKENPAVNLAFVINDSKHSNAAVYLNGKPLDKKHYKIGLVDNGLKQSLVIWIEHQSDKKFEVEIVAR